MMKVPMIDGCTSKGTLYRSTHYSLTIVQSPVNVELVMRLQTPMMTTRSLPRTQALLVKLLPTIYQTRCYNNQKLPFRHEVKDTELGHLFEHILLVFLCQEKVAHGVARSTFSGSTSWNWHTEQRGTFHIRINLHKADHLLLGNALTKTMTIFDAVLIPVRPQATAVRVLPVDSFATIAA